jgi:hypothetical protein
MVWNLRLGVMFFGILVAASSQLFTGAAAQTPTELLSRATAEINKLRDPAEKALVLADLAQMQKRLCDDRWSATLATAVAAGEAVEDVLARPMTSRGLAVRAWDLDRKLAEQLRDRAMAEADKVPYAAPRSLALREIGRALLKLDPTTSKTAFAGALAAAEKIDSPLFRSAALRDLAAAMVSLDPLRTEELLTRAAADLASIVPDEEPVQLARVELSVTWSLSNLPSALKETASIADDRLREVAYRRIVEALAPTDPESAMSVAAKLVDPGQRGLALAAVAVALAKLQPDAAAGMARSAVTMGANLPPEDVARLQATAAAAIAAVDAKEALLLASHIEDEGQAAWALGQIALAVAQSDPAQAAKMAGEITDWEVRETVQTQIAPLLAAKDAQAALAIIEAVLSRRDKVHALLAIACVMAGGTTL